MNNKKSGNVNYIFGRNPVKEALRADRVEQIFIIDAFKDREILSLVEEKHVTASKITTRELDNLSQGGVHQGIVARAKPYEYKSLEEMLYKVKKSGEKNPVVVILDGINDPHNFGAILRCSDVFGVSFIIISKHNQVSLNATVAKTSAGAINYVPVVMVNNINQTLETLKKEGFWVVATDGSGDKLYQEIDYNFPTALIIGSEGFGISSLILKNSDFVVKIPQFGHVNSLNASVACGILLSKIRN